MKDEIEHAVGRLVERGEPGMGRDEVGSELARGFKSDRLTLESWTVPQWDEKTEMWVVTIEVYES